MRELAMVTVLVLGLAAPGCQGGGTTLDGGTDTGSDPQPDTSADTSTDTTTDTTTDDPADVDAPPSGWAMHEWGVMITRGIGGTLHGPTPEYAGAIPAKPVIYVYATEPFDLDLQVRFTSGAPTETWPEIALDPLVAWNGIHVAPGPCTTTAFPTVYSDPWTDGTCEACTLGTCVVPGAACLTHGSTVATLLFYTGELPSYKTPLEIAAAVLPGPTDPVEVRFDIQNTSAHPIEGIGLVYRQTTGSCVDPSYCGVVTADIAWGTVDVVDGYAAKSVILPVTRLTAEVDDYGYPIEGTLGIPAGWEAQGAALRAAIEERGLYADEAQALMNAWDTAFFGLMASDSMYMEPLYENGASAIYFMGSGEYDSYLPLSATPSPDQAVRVGLVYQHI